MDYPRSGTQGGDANSNQKFRKGITNAAYKVGENLHKGERKGVSSAKRVLRDFKAFIKRGNVFDLAIGVVMGAAFTSIVNSLVEDLLSPLIGLISNGNLGNLFLVLRCPVPENSDTGRPPPAASCRNTWSTFEDAQKAGAITFNWGNFIQRVINFIIISVVVFFLVKVYSAAFLRKGEAKTKACIECTKEIPLPAKRCPECTSIIPLDPTIDPSEAAPLIIS